MDAVVEESEMSIRSNRKQIAQVPPAARNQTDLRADFDHAESRKAACHGGRGKSLETTVELVEGISSIRGYVSPHFVTTLQYFRWSLKSLISCSTRELLSAKDMIPILEKVAKSGRPMMIIAEDIDGEALATLVVNRLRGILQVAAVKAPGFGDRRKAMLEDIAILTGGKAIFEDLGIKLESLELTDLGSAKTVRIDKENTTIIEGAGKTSDIKARIEQIKYEMDATTSDYDREKLEERLAKLAGGVAQVMVGAATEVEMKEKKARVEDALHAARAAVEEGVLPGGGVAALRAMKAIDKLKLTGDQKTGAEIVKRALAAPIKQIAQNAGLDGSIIFQKVIENTENPNFGYDALHTAKSRYGPGRNYRPEKSNARVAETLRVRGLMLTIYCVVAEIGDKPRCPRRPGLAGMGGMAEWAECRA